MRCVLFCYQLSNKTVLYIYAQMKDFFHRIIYFDQKEAIKKFMLISNFKDTYNGTKVQPNHQELTISEVCRASSCAFLAIF